MKFGKYIQSQQSEWGGAHHLNYKALKKIINSVEALTPSSHSHSQTTISIVSSSTNSNHADTTRQFQALKTAFFFKLERELEKVNSFYLQKEQEFKVRQRSLLDKKRILQSRSVAIKTSSNLESLREAFLQFQRDLAKLQSYVEINATGFTKILKKWDKRAKSTTKEFYLSRQVVIQPCFNRDVLTELTDVVTMNIAELDALLDAAQSRTDSIPIKITVEPLQPQQRSWDPLMEAENDFLSAITESRVDYLKDSLKKFTHKSGTSASSLREEDPELLSRVFLRACDEGPIDMLSALFDSEDVTINCDFMDDISNRTCIHEAAIHGRLDVLTLAISRGKANIDAVDIYDRYGIHYAAMYGHSDCLLFLLSQYSSAAAASAVDVDDNTPLTYAIIGGHTKCVQLLLQHGVALDPPAATTLNPLSLACQYGHLAIATLLLEKGASLHNATTPASSAHPQQITEGNNLPSLHLTAREGHAELCALLIRSGADVNETDSYSGWTPIFFAASEGHISCVKVLLDAHCRVDVTDEDGWLPWTYALYHGHVDVAKLLEISQPVMKSPGSALSPTAAATVTSASPALSSSLGSLSAVVGIPIITSSGATAMAVDSSDLSVSSLGSDGPIMLADRGTADALPMDIPLQPMAPSALFSENTVVTPAAGGFEFEMSLDEIPSLSLPPPMIPFRI
ncbi:ankyrin repeat-containing domain protein [Zopfochytrium polystomum]|nr:ankyrin repeat-containing domain protein [Zopfochytrium polystomum]